MSTGRKHSVHQLLYHLEVELVADSKTYRQAGRSAVHCKDICDSSSNDLVTEVLKRGIDQVEVDTFEEKDRC